MSGAGIVVGTEIRGVPSRRARRGASRSNRLRDRTRKRAGESVGSLQVNPMSRNGGTSLSPASCSGGAGSVPGVARCSSSGRESSASGKTVSGAISSAGSVAGDHGRRPPALGTVRWRDPQAGCACRGRRRGHGGRTGSGRRRGQHHGVEGVHRRGRNDRRGQQGSSTSVHHSSDVPGERSGGWPLGDGIGLARSVGQDHQPRRSNPVRCDDPTPRSARRRRAGPCGDPAQGY